MSLARISKEKTPNLENSQNMDHCFARDVFSAAAMVTSISISALLPPKRRAHIQH